MPVLLLLAAKSSFPQSISFLAPVRIAVAAYSNHGGNFSAQAVATGDFNGDGKPDLAYFGATFGGPIGGVMLGKGDGTFRSSEVNFGVGIYPDFIAGMAVGDFNGDGKLDIALSGVQSVFVLLGKGDGTFRPPVITSINQIPGTFIVAEVTGDNIPDLIMGPYILAGNGDGTFKPSKLAFDGSALIAADFNRDGKTDVIILTASGELALVAGNGNGSFAADRVITAGFPGGGISPVSSITSGDFDSDGILDLAIEPVMALIYRNIPSSTNLNREIYSAFNPVRVTIMHGNGDGTFQTSSNRGFAASGGPLLAFDINSDGALDLVSGNSILVGKGDGTFRDPLFLAAEANGCNTFQPCNAAIALADFNGDGLPDLVFAENVVDDISEGPPTLVGKVLLLLNDSPGDGFQITGVSSVTGTWPVGGDSLVSAFGTNLSTTTEAATGIPLPTTLGGIRVHIGGDVFTGPGLAPLLYVSPGQINFELPRLGPYISIGIERVGTPYVEKGIAIPVQPVSPGLFTLNSSGLPAATVVRVSPDGTQTPVPFASCISGGCFPVPIDLTGNPVYLTLYGTGFSDLTIPSLNLLEAMQCYAGSQPLRPTYAGPQGQIPGLDQINFLLPKVSGNGDLAISCSFGPDLAGTTNFANIIHISTR